MEIENYEAILNTFVKMDISQLENLILVATMLKNSKETTYQKDVEELRELIDDIRANYPDKHLYITTDPEYGNDEIDLIQSKKIFVIASNKT